LDNRGYDPIQAQEVSIVARVSAAKSKTRRKEGEERKNFEEKYGVDQV
jgi:hypothetical protein